MNMKAFVSIIGVAGLCCLVPVASRAADDTTAKAVLYKWAGTLTHGSVDKMVSFYEDSRDVLAIQSTGRVRKGAAEIRKEYEAAFAEVQFEGASLADLVVRRSGDVAWATGELRADTIRRSDSTQWTLRVYTSFVLKFSGETWKIVLEQSTPMAGVPRVKQRARSPDAPNKPAEGDGLEPAP